MVIMQGKNNPLVIVLALVAVLLAGAAFIVLQDSNPADERGTLSGNVVDASDSSYLKGVKVTAVDRDGERYTSHENTDTTGDDGYFMLELPPNDYTLLFEADGFKTFESSSSYTVKKDKDTRIDEAFRLGASEQASDSSGLSADTAPAPSPDAVGGSVPETDTDTPPAEASYTIPPDAITYGGHSYYADRVSIESISTFWEAESYAESLGGHLAVIANSEVNKVLYDYVFNTLGYESAYFGLTDDGSEGIWTWVNGSENGYRNWGKGQPDDRNGNENYALFYYKDKAYTWNDGDFGPDRAGTVTFLIEWDTE
ncbi:MAG: hypothetical protein E7238_04075 [Sarcina sp.]|nr:hypothetical protein [Sarcina sp.]